MKYNKQEVTSWKLDKHSEAVKKLIDAVKWWLNVSSACAFSKITRPLYYTRVKDPEFLSQIDNARDYWLWVVENEKRKLIMQWHWPAIEKELKSKMRDVYWDKLWLDDWDGGNLFWNIKIKIVK